MIYPTRLPKPPKRIRYGRKSSEQEDRQVASVARQMEEADGKFGPLPDPKIIFTDDKSGKSWDRPGFRQMEEWCKVNFHPTSSPGVIEVYDLSRFGRILMPDGTEDVLAVAMKMQEFEKLGWQVVFVHLQRTGNPLIDALLVVLESYGASKYLRDLSRVTKEGRLKVVKDSGRFSGGKAPFGTHRVHPKTGKILGPGERALQGGSILAPNEDELRHWYCVAEMVLGGESYSACAARLQKEGVPTAFGGAWDRSTIKWILSNPYLIGKIHYPRYRLGKEPVLVYDACWTPIVPVELFEKVQREIRRRDNENGPGVPLSKRSKGLLQLTCSRCGLTFYYQERGPGDGKPRYWHPATSQKSRPEILERIRKHDCKHWSINATEAHEAVKQLLLRERTSPEFVKHLKEVISARGDLESEATERLKAAEAAIRKLEQRQQAILDLQIEAKLNGQDPRVFFERFQATKRQIEEANAEKVAALELKASAVDAWEQVWRVVDETQHIESIFEHGTHAERKKLIDYWVKGLLIVIEPVEGKPHTAKKSMVAFLRVAPNIGQAIELGAKGGDECQIMGPENRADSLPGSHHSQRFTIPLVQHQLAA